MLILWAGQPGQAQFAPVSLKKRSCGDLWPVHQDKKWGYIDKTGKLIIPFKFDGADYFSEGLAAVYFKGKCGYIDKTGNFVIPPRFLEGYSFTEGLAIVVIRRFEQDQFHMNEFAYIDRSGKIVIQPREALDSKSFFVSMSFRELDFSEGLFPVEQNGKFGYMDKSGKMAIHPRYLAAAPFSEGLAAVKLNDGYGYIDRSGKMVIPPRFESAAPFSDGLAFVEVNAINGYIDKSGKLVVNGTEFVVARGFSQGLAAVMGKNEKYGFIDKTGKFVIQPQFARAGDFFEGLAAVEPLAASWPGNLSYITPSGQIVISLMSTFPDAPMKTEADLHRYRFCGGIAWVNLGKKEDDGAGGYINKAGKFLWSEATPLRKELR